MRVLNGYIDMRTAAAAAGVPRRTMIRRLQRLHAQHGDVLVRFGDGPRSKLWTTPGALAKRLPERFAQVTELDLLELRETLADHEERIAILERD